MSAGNLTNGVLNVATCYVDGVEAGSVTGVASLNGLTGAVTFADTATIDASTFDNNVVLNTKVKYGIEPSTATFNTMTITVPGVTANSVVFATINFPDTVDPQIFIKNAVPSADTITVRLSDTTSVATTQTISWVVTKL